MKPSTGTLMAYVDGELDARACAEVETAMVADPAVAQEVEHHRTLRHQLQSAFGDVLSEPVPERLLAAARTSPAGTQQTKVTDLTHAHATRGAGTRRRWSLPEWSAMAACLVVGLFLGQQLWHSQDSGPLRSEDGHLVARGTLNRALNTQLSGAPAAGDVVRIALSFRDQTGQYCRTFVMQDGSGLAGLACREQTSWRLHALQQGTAEPTGEGYRMAAGALPASVLHAAQDRIEGEPLDATAEAAARNRGWN